MDSKLQDSWHAGDPYEYYMGRWSKLVAELFVDWLSPGKGKQWLDVGCGSGALSEAIIERQHPQSLIALDQSEGFLHSAQKRLGDKASYKLGNAMSLPLEDDSIDVAVSGLVLNFIADKNAALAELRRILRQGGIAAVYIWDYAGDMEFLNHFWDAATELFSDAAELHEGQRFPDANADHLTGAFNQVGLFDVASTGLVIQTHFLNFDDYWLPFLGGQGPAPTYVSTLKDSAKLQLKQALQQKLPLNLDGSITLKARAWAARGRK